MSLIERCRARCRGEEGEEGFTLIELLVVLLIIGILLAIAIPTFLSVTKGANSTAAQSNLQTALTGADTYYTNASQSYSNLLQPGQASASTLTQVDTGLTYVSAAASTGTHTVSVAVLASGQALMLTAWAPGQNDCWGILDIKSTQTTAIEKETAVGTYYFVSRNPTTGSAACQAASNLAISGSPSSTKFPAG